MISVYYNYFPFFKSYNTTMVVLGIIGTIWGLIMIGYYKNVDMAKLVLCLRTALFSSLVAFIWVYLIARPVSKTMRFWQNIISGQPNEKASVANILNKVAAAGVEAANGLGKVANQANGLDCDLSELKRTVSRTTCTLKEFEDNLDSDVFRTINDSCSVMKGTCERVEETLSAVKTESEERQKLITEQQKAIQEMLQEVREERKLRTSAQARVEQLERENSATGEKIKQIKKIASVA